MNAVNNTFSVIFYLKKYKTSVNGKAPIYARITVNGSRVDLSVKRSIVPGNWHASKGMAKGSKAEMIQLNGYLEQYRAGIVDSYQELLFRKKLITAELVKSKFTGEDKADFTLCKLIDHHNKEQIEVLEKGTIKNYFTTQKYLKEFLLERHKTSDKYLSELNYKFITDFEFFLRTREPDQVHKPIGNNGVMKHLERLCKMINMAVRLDWIESHPFQAYKLKFEKVDREYLTKTELECIEARNFSITRLQIVKDIFIFSCYTGLAYIDVFNLVAANVVRKSGNSSWLITNRQKTTVQVKVPLLPKAMAIIEKYEGHPMALGSGKLLPVFSNQKLNSYLKEIADMCGITKPLTFHIARHTFATTVTLTNGVPLETISKLLGHTKMSTTQIYAKVIEDKINEDMDALRKRLET